MIEEYDLEITKTPLPVDKIARLRERLDVGPFTWRVLSVQEADQDLDLALDIYARMEVTGELEGSTADEMVSTLREIYTDAMQHPIKLLLK